MNHCERRRELYRRRVLLRQPRKQGARNTAAFATLAEDLASALSIVRGRMSLSTSCSGLLDIDDVSDANLDAAALRNLTEPHLPVFMLLDQKVTLKEIADEACMSRFHFARVFRQIVGVSPMEYLLTLRIDRAKMLLVAGNLPLCEIATSVGFADQSHFTRRFRRRVGMTPGQFARQWAVDPRYGS